MNKRKLGIFIPLFIYTLIFAQDDPIVASGGYSKIYKGKEASFEKAVSNHVTKWHGADLWPTFAANVMSGTKIQSLLDSNLTESFDSKSSSPALRSVK